MLRVRNSCNIVSEFALCLVVEDQKISHFIPPKITLRWNYRIGSSTSLVCKGMRVQKGKSLLCLHPFDVVVIVDCASYIFERCFDRNLCELWDIVALCA